MNTNSRTSQAALMSSKIYETPKREFLVFYYKYRFRLVSAFVLPFLLSIFISFLPTPRYQAASTLVIRAGSEHGYQAENSANGSTAPISFDHDRIYKAEIAILGSYDLHEQVIRNVGLDRMYPTDNRGRLQGILKSAQQSALSFVNDNLPENGDGWLGEIAASARTALKDYDSDTHVSDEEKARRRMQIAVQNFDKRLQITLGKDSSVITVTFEHPDQATAIRALGTLLSLYLEKRNQLYPDARGGTARIVQPPATPPQPEKLQSLIILAGFMVSLIISVIVAALTEFSRSGFLTPERLERNLGLPVLAALPYRK